MSSNPAADKATPHLDFEQRQHANLIAESRGIDLDTASELVYRRDQAAAVDALASALERTLTMLRSSLAGRAIACADEGIAEATAALAAVAMRGEADGE